MVAGKRTPFFQWLICRRPRHSNGPSEVGSQTFHHDAVIEIPPRFQKALALLLEGRSMQHKPEATAGNSPSRLINWLPLAFRTMIYGCW